MKKLAPLLVLLLALPLIGAAQGISQLQQFTATTSPERAITQTVFGKPLRLTGQGSGCAQFSANGTLTSTGINCGSGSSNLFGKAWEIISGFLTPTTTVPVKINATTTLATTTSPVFNNIYYAKGFGAKCDGSTNDSPALNAAINATASTGGGTVVLPSGVCVVTSGVNTLLNNVAVQGAGKNITILQASGSGFQVLSFGAGSGPTVYSNFMVKDLTIDMNKINSTNAYGLVFAAAQNVLVANVKVINAGQNSKNQLYFGVANGSSQQYARNLRVQTSEFLANYGSFEQVLFAQAKDITFIDNTVASTTSLYGLLQYCSNGVILEGNTFASSSGVRLDRRTTRVQNNRFYNASLQLTGSEETQIVSGNDFSGTPPSGVSGITLQADVRNPGDAENCWDRPPVPYTMQSNAIIEGNTFNNANSNSISAGITTNGSTSTLSADKITVLNNTFYATYWQGVDLHANYLDISHNTFLFSGQLGSGAVKYNMALAAATGTVSFNSSFGTSTVTSDFFIDNQYSGSYLPTQDWTFVGNTFTVGSVPRYYTGSTFTSTRPANITLRGIGNGDNSGFDFWTLGNLGVGTTSPFAKLSVAGNAYIGGNLTATGTLSLIGQTDGCAVFASGVLNSTGSLCGSSFGYPFIGNAPTTRLNFDGGITAYASSTVGAGTQASGLTVSGGATTTGNGYVAGNFGIKTLSPTLPFVVTGQAWINSATSPSIKIGDGSTGSIFLGDSQFASKTGGSYVNWQGNVFSNLTNLNVGYGQSTDTASTFKIRANSIDSLFIPSATGNVGIGTTSPASRLHVSSGASATTTVSIGELGLASSKSCVNMNRSDGGAGSFYINAAGVMVTEPNYCR